MHSVRSWFALLLAAVSSICAASSMLCAQFTFVAGDASGVAGSTVTVAVELDNSDPVRAFSFGITHDPAVLSLSVIDQGADVMATNGGAGADYFFADVAAEGGSGGIVGCVLTLGPPLEDLPIAPDNEIALCEYTIDAGVSAGTVTTVSFSNDLGDPPVASIVSVAGTTFVPAFVGGEVTVLTFALNGFACAQPDPCVCAFEASWSNPTPFDAIRVYEDGVLMDTLSGSTNSYDILLDTGESVLLEVAPVVGVLEGTRAECDLACVALTPPAAPAMLACDVDLSTCIAAISWQNGATYASVTVSLDGALSATLAGSAAGTSLTLTDAAPHEICIVGIDACGLASPAACCTVSCPELFERGDGNGDGTTDISDAITVLQYLFVKGEAGCIDALDVNDDGAVGIADAIFELSYLFQDGLDPPQPLVACGADPTTDALGCLSSPSCQ